MKRLLIVFFVMSVFLGILNAQISAFPWLESFDGEEFPPFGWTVIDADGDGYNWLRVTSPGYSTNTGEGAVMSESFTVPYIELMPDNYLITPQIILPGNVATLSWYVRVVSSWFTDEMYSVMVSTTTPTLEAFTSVFTEVLTIEEVS